MTSTHCKSVALGRIIAPWAVKIAEFLGTIVKIILTIVEKVRNTVHELGACCRKIGRRLMALRVGLSRPMLPKLKTMGAYPGAEPSQPRTLAQTHCHPVPPGLDNAAGSVLLADIGAAPTRITDNRRRPVLVPMPGEKLVDFEELEAHHSRSEQLL
jgi:hypothetical protein